MSTTTPPPAQTPAAPETQIPATETGTKTIPIVDEKRQQKRRATDHSPEDCHKLLSVQGAMDEVNAKLAEVKATLDAAKTRLNDGSARMGRIEASVANVTAIIERGAASHVRVEGILSEQCAITQLNAVAIQEIRTAQDALNVIQATISAQSQIHARAIEDMHAAQKQNNADTAELLEIVKAAKGFFKVAGWLAGAAKPLVVIVASIIGAYATVKGWVGK